MMSTPVAPFSYVSTLWVQLTGTWCNLQCVHCINASGPKQPWLKSLDTKTVKRAIQEAESFGVKEIYFTGGEPTFRRPSMAFAQFLELVQSPLGRRSHGTNLPQSDLGSSWPCRGDV